MALTNVPYRIEGNLLERGHIIKAHIEMLLEIEELTHMLLFSSDDLRLYSNYALFNKLQELSRIFVESRTFIGEVIKELKQVHLYVIVELRVTLHNDLLYLFSIPVFQVGADRNHQSFEAVCIVLQPLLLGSHGIIKRPVNNVVLRSFVI